MQQVVSLWIIFQLRRKMLFSSDTLPLFLRYCFLTSPVGFLGNVCIFLYSLIKLPEHCCVVLDHPLRELVPEVRGSFDQLAS